MSEITQCPPSIMRRFTAIFRQRVPPSSCSPGTKCNNEEGVSDHTMLGISQGAGNKGRGRGLLSERSIQGMWGCWVQLVLYWQQHEKKKEKKPSRGRLAWCREQLDDYVLDCYKLFSLNSVATGKLLSEPLSLYIFLVCFKRLCVIVRWGKVWNCSDPFYKYNLKYAQLVTNVWLLKCLGFQITL